MRWLGAAVYANQSVNASGRGTDAGNTVLHCCRLDGSEGSCPLDHCGGERCSPQIDWKPTSPATVGQSVVYPRSECASSRMPPIPVSQTLR
jgi:hypothetical protein